MVNSKVIVSMPKTILEAQNGPIARAARIEIKRPSVIKNCRHNSCSEFDPCVVSRFGYIL